MSRFGSRFRRCSWKAITFDSERYSNDRNSHRIHRRLDRCRQFVCLRPARASGPFRTSPTANDAATNAAGSACSTFAGSNPAFTGSQSGPLGRSQPENRSKNRPACGSSLSDSAEATADTGCRSRRPRQWAKCLCGHNELLPALGHPLPNSTGDRPQLFPEQLECLQPQLLNEPNLRPCANWYSMAANADTLRVDGIVVERADSLWLSAFWC